MRAKEGFDIALRRRRGIFLDQERGRGVAAEQRQQAFANAAVGDESRHIGREFVKTGAARANRGEACSTGEAWRRPSPASAARASDRRDRLAAVTKQKRPPGRALLTL